MQLLKFGLESFPRVQPGCSPSEHRGLVKLECVCVWQRWQRWVTRAAGPSLQAGVKSSASRREEWEQPQLPQLLPTCFFYRHLQVFGIISLVAVVTTVDSGAVSRPLCFSCQSPNVVAVWGTSCQEAVGQFTGGSSDRHAFQYWTVAAGKSIVWFTGSAPGSISPSQYLLQPDHAAQQFFF